MLVVDDYDRAIGFYVDVLGFALLEDTPMGPDKRWVRVGPAGGAGTGLVLGRATSAAQLAAVGNQAGGRVFLFLETDDFWRDYAHLEQQGVRVSEARQEAYGTVAVFEDLYGNKWDLVQPAKPAAAP